MTVLITPKTECSSPDHWRSIQNSGGNLDSPGETNVERGMLSKFSSPPSPDRTMPNRADNSEDPEENTNKSHESTGWSIVCLPLRDLAATSETKLAETIEGWKVKSEFDNVLGDLTDAKSVVRTVGLKWNALENVVQDNKKHKAECEEGKKLLEDTRRVLGEKTTKVQALRVASLVAVEKKETILKDAKDEIKRMHRNHDAVVSDVYNEMRTVEAEKDAMVSQMRGLIAQYEALKREADNRLSEFASEKFKLNREFHSAMLDQRAKFDAELHNVLVEKKRLEHDVAALVQILRNLPNLKIQRDEMEKERDAALTELAGEREKRENGEEAIRILNLKLTAAQSRKRKLEGDNASVLEESDRQHATKETVQRKLDEELRKALCQTCLVTPKDAIALPCLHWNFCFICLDEHYQLHKTCPCCKISISGVLRCNIPQLAINVLFAKI